MTMITQHNEIIQAIDEKIIKKIPIVQYASGGAIYILLKELPEETTKFIQGESFTEMELPVLPEDLEEMVIAGWRSRGFKCTYCWQSMEYLEREAIIKYLHVINPETGVSIYLLPWFMLPRKRFPVQVYAYAAWYNTIANMSAGIIETAEVVKALFKLETFDASTVWRTKAQITRIFREQTENGGVLPKQEPEIASTTAILDWVTEALMKQPPAESIENADEMEAPRIETQPIPATSEDGGQPSETRRSAEKTTNSGGNEVNGGIGPGGRNAQCAKNHSVIAFVLGSIPQALAEIKKQKTPVKHERRERPTRERGERLKAKHKEIDFIEPDRLEAIRNDFTEICKKIVLNTALIYHKLLI